MPIFTILLVIIVAGILLWLVNSLIPMDAVIKKILNVVVIVVLLLWILEAFGVLQVLKSARI